MLRRLKADHLVLPPKRECEVHVPLTPLQRKWYRAVLERNVAALGAANARGLVNVLAALRKCTNHPYLFAGAEPEPFVEGEHLVDASAKLKVADRLLKRLRARGSRVLLFSQSTQTLDVLQDYLHLRGWDYERLDGSVRSEERWAAARLPSEQRRRRVVVVVVVIFRRLCLSAIDARGRRRAQPDSGGHGDSVRLGLEPADGPAGRRPGSPPRADAPRARGPPDVHGDC